MKYLAIILLFLVAFGSIEAVKARHRIRHRNKAASWTSNLGAFVKGALIAYIGSTNVVEGFLACINYSDEDETASKASETTDVSSGAIETESNFSKYMGYLGKAVDFICMVKDTVEAFFQEQRRRFYRRQRMFNEGKNQVTWWAWVDSVVNAAKKLTGYIASAGTALFEKAKTVATKFADLAKDGLDLAKAKAEEIATWTKAKLKSVFSVVGAWLDGLKTKIKTFLASRQFTTLTNFIKCVTAGKVITNDGLKKFIMPFIEIPANVTKLVALDPTAWVKLIVNLICGWEKFKKAYESFVAAWKATGTAKWENYGKFAGYIGAIIIGALSRRR